MLLFNMAIGEIKEVIKAFTNSSALDAIEPSLTGLVGGLITIIKAIGIVVLIYLIFLIVRWFFTLKRYRIIKRMDKKVDEINLKLDLLLTKSKQEEVKKEISEKTKKEKKKTFLNKIFKKEKTGNKKSIKKLKKKIRKR